MIFAECTDWPWKQFGNLKTRSCRRLMERDSAGDDFEAILVMSRNNTVMILKVIKNATYSRMIHMAGCSTSLQYLGHSSFSHEKHL